MAQDNSLGKNDEEIKILVEDQESLRSSHSVASHAISTGYDVLSSFKRQEEMLKVKFNFNISFNLIYSQKIQKRAYTILGELGISTSFAKLIERRSRNDFYIMVCLFIFLVAFTFLLYYYIRPRLWK